MVHSQRWCLGAGILALGLTGALALIAAHVSSRAADRMTGSAGAATIRSDPAVRRAGPWSPGRELAGSAPPPQITSRANRRERIEISLQPLLLRPGLRAGVFGYDPSGQVFFTLDGGESFAAASLIKIPLAVAVLTAVDRGDICLEETLEMRAQEVAAGSGRIQYLPVGSPFSVERLAELMIRKSDNTATNMLISRLGGIEAANSIFASWGLGRTRIANLLPDLEGTNRTSPQDLVTILHWAVDGGLLSPQSRVLLLAWMSRSHVRSMIPAGVGAGAFVANKTGDIPGALGDVGYVLTSGGRRYLLAVQVERPRNSARAKELVRTVSGAVWKAMTGLPSPLAQDRGHGGRGTERRAARRARSRPSSS